MNGRTPMACPTGVRGEAFNLENRPVFSGPETSPTNQNFGKSTGQDNQPRSIQIGLRLKW